MIRHVVLLRWKESADPEDVALFGREVEKLATEVGTVRRFVSGPNVGDSSEGLAGEAQFESNYDHAVIVDFDDYAGYKLYADSDAHHRLVERVVRRILDARVAVQFEVPPS